MTNAYSVNDPNETVVHAYKSFSIPTGNPVNLEFDWKGIGENNFDYLRVWVVPDSATLVPGTRVTTANTPGAQRLGGNFHQETTWQTESFVIPASFTGADVKVVFEWINDYGYGSGDAAAVDNVSLRQQTCATPTDLTINSATFTSTHISWSSLNTITDWNISWGPTGYTPGDTLQLGTMAVTDTFAVISGLTPETHYSVYVQSNCGLGTSSWVGPINVFTGYCIPNYSYTSEYTGGFATLNAISNVTYTASSQPTPNGYLNLATDTIMQVIGDTVWFSHVYMPNHYSSAVTIWVDWNNDLQFDASEVVRETTAGSNSIMNSFFVIPTGTTVGDYRLRMRSAYGSTAPSNPCNTEAWGTALDFTLSVVELPVAPSIVQAAGLPTCNSGTDLTASGTAGTNDVWYWQTSATGTDVANNASNPWTVYTNGTYYVRALDTLYNVWSVANSFVVVNIPTAPTPPSPVALQTPVCLPGTTISVASATGSLVYYWQGNDSTSYEISNNANTPDSVTTTGTYYVKAYDTVSGCWSWAIGVDVVVDTYIPNVPSAIDTLLSICAGANSQELEVSVETTPITTIIGANLQNYGTLTVPFTVPSLPNGAVITSAELQLDSVVAVGGSWRSEIRVAITGDYTLATTQLSTLSSAGLITPNPTIPLTGFPTSGGNFNLELSETTDDGGVSVLDATFGVVRLVLNYTVPSSVSVNWYDASTAGNLINSDTNRIEAVGTSVLPSPATVGTYEFYAEAVSGACVSPTRTLITVVVNNVNVEITPVHITCNNANNGTFAVADTTCGVAPFTYSVNGGAFGAIPTDLVAGTYTVIVKDANDEVSIPYTIVVDEATAPSNIIVNSYTNDQVLISWTSGASETAWNVEWSTDSTFATVQSAVATDTFYTITGLTGSTEYFVRVSANCGGATTPGQWTSTTVLTDCDPLTAIGYCEDFEGFADMDYVHCMNLMNLNGDNRFWNVGFDSSNSQSGGYHGFFPTWFTGNHNDYLILPYMTLTGQEVLKFGFKNNGEFLPGWADSSTLRVVLSTTGIGPNNFTEELAVFTFASDTFENAMINLSAYTGNVHIAFHVAPGSTQETWRIYIDNICIDRCHPELVSTTQQVCRADEEVYLNSYITTTYNNAAWSFPTDETLLNGDTLDVSDVTSLSAGIDTAYYIIDSTFYYTVNIGGCAIDTLNLVRIDLHNANNAGDNNTTQSFCKNQTIDLSSYLSSTADVGGTWYRPNGSVITGSPVVSTGILPGQFAYEYVVSGGYCPDATATITVIVGMCDSLGLDNNSLSYITIAPNPNTGKFQIIGTPSSDYAYEVLDINGRVIRKAEAITSSTTDVDLTDVETGVYMIRIMGDSSQKMIRVVKQ